MQKNRKRLKALLGSKDLFILDGDGTLYLWDKALPFATELLRRLNSIDKRFVIISNNDSKSKKHRIKEISKILRVEISDKNLILPNDLLKNFLKEKRIRSFDGLVTADLKEELVAEGFVHDTINPEIVIVGFDTEITYEKIKRTIMHINLHKRIVLTHIDELCPYRDGEEIPDAGMFMKLLTAATGRNADYVLGKPFKGVIDLALKLGNSDKRSSLVIGDRMDTDIKMAYQNGIRSILVSGRGYASQKTSPYRPDFRVGSLEDVYRLVSK
ncbi:HAD-IIA family hydrolase [Candidatus Parvarchaeota archaeon]|nr:HAD-IIA family hydrolase [Candidatus Parvarchaeota archaeon]